MRAGRKNPILHKFAQVAAIYLLLCSSLAVQIRAEVINLGLVTLDGSATMLGPGMAADLLRRGVVDTVFRVKNSDATSKNEIWKSEDGKNAYKMNLVDSMMILTDSSAWSFRLKSGIRFHNGQSLYAKDIESSLQRCMQEGLFSDFAEISGEARWKTDLAVNTEQDKNLDKNWEQWIVLKLNSENIEKVRNEPSYFTVLQSRLADGLASCPVTEMRTSAIFAQNLGYGTNVVSLGEYSLIRFQAGKEYIMERVFQERGSREGAQTIVLRKFNDGAHALTALRLGTVDAIFVDSDAAEIAKGMSDQTLKVAKCMTGSVIHRIGLSIPCDAYSFRLAQIRYTG